MFEKVREKAPTVARLLFGLVFFVFGLNGFLGFMPQPPHEGAAGAFLGGLAGAGYFFPLLKGTEVVAGALLLTKRAVPLALVLIAPVTVNILAFHVFLEPATAGMAVVLTLINVYLAWTVRDAYRPLFASSAAKRSTQSATSDSGALPSASRA